MGLPLEKAVLVVAAVKRIATTAIPAIARANKVLFLAVPPAISPDSSGLVSVTQFKEIVLENGLSFGSELSSCSNFLLLMPTIHAWMTKLRLPDTGA